MVSAKTPKVNAPSFRCAVPFQLASLASTPPHSESSSPCVTHPMRRKCYPCGEEPAVTRPTSHSRYRLLIRGYHTNFRRGRPRFAVDFRQRAQFDELALYAVKRHGLFFPAGIKRALFHRLGYPVVVADIEFVIFDQPVIAIVLARKISESFQSSRLAQLNNGFCAAALDWRPAIPCARTFRDFRPRHWCRCRFHRPFPRCPP